MFFLYNTSCGCLCILPFFFSLTFLVFYKKYIATVWKIGFWLFFILLKRAIWKSWHRHLDIGTDIGVSIAKFYFCLNRTFMSITPQYSSVCSVFSFPQSSGVHSCSRKIMYELLEETINVPKKNLL